MKFNNPLPQPLPKECQKAAKIFHSFVDSKNNGLDGVVPRSVLEQARGFAIFSVMKAGFVFSARAGSGIVIARLDDGSWSAPSAIGTAGVGVGGQAGAEMTDFLIVLNSKSAIKSFMAAGSLTLGGNLSVAVGPLGRNGEALGSLNTSGKMAAMYSYSKTRGLFGGVSLEGSVIVERQDANAIAYNTDVTVKMLLSGALPPPEWAKPLIQTLESCTGMPGNHKWVQDAPEGASYAFSGVGSPRASPQPGFLRKKGRSASGSGSLFPPGTWGRRKSSGSYFSNADADDLPGADMDSERESGHRPTNSMPTLGGRTPSFETHFDSDYVPDEAGKTRAPHFSFPQSRTPDPPIGNLLDLYPIGPSSPALYSPTTKHNPFGPPTTSPTISHDRRVSDDSQTGHSRKPTLSLKPELLAPLPPGAVGRAIALYDFTAAESGDLSFRTGQVITIMQKSESTDDWWRGRVDGREGIFPANFVEVS